MSPRRRTRAPWRLFAALACAARAELAGGGGKSLLIGVMSMLADVERRHAMRETWIGEARELAPSVAVRFVLGRAQSEEERALIDRENATYGDLVVLPCDENQHRGKTALWIQHAFETFAHAFTYVAKMDQDCYVWPTELADHIPGFADSKFYAGVLVDIWLTQLGADRFAFMNGGFAVLSMDLAAEVAQLVRSIEPTPQGFLQHRVLVGNEDVSLGRIFKPHWEDGTLNMNGGSFNWSLASPAGQGTGASSEFPPGDPRYMLRACPWRHAKDLKYATGYRRQWENRHVKGCRCNCPEDYSPEEAEQAKRAFAAKAGPFKSMEELDAWRDREKAKQKAQNERESERLKSLGQEGFGWRAKSGAKKQRKGKARQRAAETDL